MPIWVATRIYFWSFVNAIDPKLLGVIDFIIKEIKDLKMQLAQNILMLQKIKSNGLISEWQRMQYFDGFLKVGENEECRKVRKLVKT